MEKKEKNVVEEALTPNNGWKPWERILGVVIGVPLVAAHKFDQLLKKTGIESEDDTYEMEPWDYR